MSEQLPAEEVEAWDLRHAVTRTIIETTAATISGAGKQSKLWMAVWVAITLMTTVVLALADAPVVAYGIPAIALFLVANTGTHR